MSSSKDIALLIVDVQNDFLPPDGRLAVNGGRDILPHICELLDKGGNWPWVKVVASQDYHPNGHVSFVTSHPGCQDKTFQSIKVKTPQGEYIDQILWPEHCVQGTPGCEIEESIQTSLKPWQSAGQYHLVQKGTDKQMDAYSAFASPSTPSVKRSLQKDSIARDDAIKGSPLAAYLLDHSVSTIVVVGIATDVCVKATAEDALACGFGIILVEEAMKGVDEGNCRQTLEGFKGTQGARVVRSVNELRAVLEES